MLILLLLDISFVVSFRFLFVAEFPCIVLINVSNSLVTKLVKFTMLALHSKYCATAIHIIAGRGK